MKIKTPFNENRLLNPIERISEILFGLIMALSFTCTLGVVNADQIEVKTMLKAAIGCNLAWGIIDAVMYLINTLAERGHDITILNFVRKSNDAGKSRKYIAETFSPELAGIIKEDSLEQIRQDILKDPSRIGKGRLVMADLKSAFGVFLLVFLSTIPVAIPFTFIEDLRKALRISNGVAVVLLFIGGWILAGYSGYNKIRTGFILAIVGSAMVFLTILLGG